MSQRKIAVADLFSGNRRRRSSAIATVLTVLLLVAWQWVAGGRYPTDPGPDPAGDGWETVVRVVDGDTVELADGEKVRYIGINTPETVKSNAPVECYGHEASVYNKQLVEGRRVRLAKDVSDRDRYGRLLRFVYLEDGTFVNDILVREGYAYASTFPPDVSKADEFTAAQAEARDARRGLWSPDTCDGKK